MFKVCSVTFVVKNELKVVKLVRQERVSTISQKIFLDFSPDPFRCVFPPGRCCRSLCKQKKSMTCQMKKIYLRVVATLSLRHNCYFSQIQASKTKKEAVK